MSASYSEAVREGTLAAARLHTRLDTRRRLEGSSPLPIDVMSAALDLRLVLLFRPLKGLLGAYLPSPTPGIIINSERPLSIQRFTTAHELGHFCLRHSPSIDDEGALRRGLMDAPDERGSFQEVEANAFAAAFLLPQWLVVRHCKHQDWLGAHLQSPEILYQLSLRVGTSYEALCWTLYRYHLMPRDIAAHNASLKPRDFKIKLLGDVRPHDYRGDVWLISERDEGTTIFANPYDHFLIRLKEHASSGYLWDFAELERSGFLTLHDASSSVNSSSIGGVSERRLIVRRDAIDAPKGPLTCVVRERRPWLPGEVLQEFRVTFSLQGPEMPGLSRAERERLLGTPEWR